MKHLKQIKIFLDYNLTSGNIYICCSIAALYKVYYQTICYKNYDALFFNCLPPFVLVFFVLTE